MSDRDIESFLVAVWDVITGVCLLIERILQLVTRIVVNLLLIAALAVLYYGVMAGTGESLPHLASFVDFIRRVFDSTMVWAVSLILAASVGILHLWRLQLDQRRFWEERAERRRQEQKERDEERARLRGPLYQKAKLHGVEDHPMGRPDLTSTTITMEELRKRIDKRE
ncbi:MAG: hypothetical protein ACJ8NR_18960 [Sulfurifustis sp.]